MSINKNIFGAIFFGILAFVIVFPLLSPGFILSFDTVVGPFKPQFPSFFSNTFLFGSILSSLSLVFSTAILEKVWLFLIFFLSGWGMYRLAGKNSIAAGIFAGTLFAVNSFVYERVLIGHWGLLLGYGLLPFMVEAILSKKSVFAAIIATFILSIDIHFALIFVPILLVLPIFTGNIKQIAIFWGTLLFLNLNWLIPAFLGHSELITIVDSFNVNDLIAFRSFADPNYGLVFNLLSGYGFWAGANHYFTLPKDVFMFWPLLSVMILSVVLVGIYKIFKEGDVKEKTLAVAMVILMVLALDFAGGVALPASRDMFISLYDKFPILRGLREPQKVIGLVMFCFAFFGAYGVEFLVKKKKIFLILLILPLIYTPTVFGSFWGQLRPVDYPASWSKVKTILDTHPGKNSVLAFPWHQYMRYRFNNNQAVVNIGPLYFGNKILSSQEYETKYLDSHETRVEALHVSGLLRIQKEGINLLGEKVDSPVDWAQNLSVIGVKYILMSKEEDWQDYQFLDTDQNLKKIYDDENFILYENLLYVLDLSK